MLSEIKDLLGSAESDKLDELAPVLDYDPSELDYAFLNTCSDVKRLKQLLGVLQYVSTAKVTVQVRERRVLSRIGESLRRQNRPFGSFV